MSTVTLAIDLEPSGLESTLLAIGAIGACLACIVVGVLYLRNRR
jgi:hypothetical protein